MGTTLAAVRSSSAIHDECLVRTREDNGHRYLRRKDEAGAGRPKSQIPAMSFKWHPDSSMLSPTAYCHPVCRVPPADGFDSNPPFTIHVPEVDTQELIAATGAWALDVHANWNAQSRVLHKLKVLARHHFLR